MPGEKTWIKYTRISKYTLNPSDMVWGLGVHVVTSAGLAVREDLCKGDVVVSSVQSLSRVRLLATPWTAAHQASRSITSSWSLLRLTSIESVMPSNHLILCHPLFLQASIFLSIKVFSNESILCIRWPKYWSFSFSICPSNEYSRLISFRMDWLDGSPCSPRESQESSPTPQFKSINSLELSFLHSPTLTSIHDHWKNHSFD